MKQAVIVAIFVVIVTLPTTSCLAANTGKLEQLNQSIEVAVDSRQKAQLLVYRARHHYKAGHYLKSESDYFAAITSMNQGWIWAELAGFYANINQLNKAEKVVAHINKNFPFFKKDINHIEKFVREQLGRAYAEANPPEIIINTVAEPYQQSTRYRYPVSTPLSRKAARSHQAEKDSIIASCRSKWGSDRDMVEYCIDEQTKSREVVKSHSGGIRQRCEQKWGDDFRMVEYCIQEHSIAKRNLEEVYRNHPKRTSCEQKWGKDYRMVEYCIKN